MTQHGLHEAGSAGALRTRVGAQLQRRIDRLSLATARSQLRSLLLGVGLALAVVSGGLALFLLVWALLVGVIK